MKRSLERHLPFPVLLWRATTQPFWNMLAWAVDLLIRIKLRQMDVKNDATESLCMDVFVQHVSI